MSQKTILSCSPRRVGGQKWDSVWFAAFRKGLLLLFAPCLFTLYSYYFQNINWDFVSYLSSIYLHVTN